MIMSRHFALYQPIGRSSWPCSAPLQDATGERTIPSFTPFCPLLFPVFVRASGKENCAHSGGVYSSSRTIGGH